MNRKSVFWKYSTFIALCLLLLSCEGRRQVEGNEEVIVDTAEKQDTATVVETGRTADQQLEEFRAWLNRQADKGDTAIRQEWPEVREELRRKNAELESRFDSLSTKGKTEFRELQDRYNRWEERQERRQQLPLEKQQLVQWQQQLLREYSNLNSVTATNVREAYLTFMGVVRTKRRNWSQNDWDYVDNVYSQLNQRRRQIEENISTADNLKIRALQAEYLALEGSADTKSMLNSR